MQKPTLCEVLGVEMLETFKFREHFYSVDQNGTLLEYHSKFEIESCNTKTWACANGMRICEIIQCADEIKHIALWSDRDIKDAKAVLRLFPNAEKVCAGSTRDFVEIVLDTGQKVRLAQSDAFPSIKTNCRYCLDEILGAKK